MKQSLSIQTAQLPTTREPKKPFHTIALRPGVTNINQWQPVDRKRSVPDKLRKVILARDDYTCSSCGHRALKSMHIHHIAEGENDDPSHLCTLCAACHAVMHFGMNMMHGSIEIWKSPSPISQVEIVRATREGIKKGLQLQEINASFNLKKGKLAPGSFDWGNGLLRGMGPEPRAELPEPLCAVFVKFKTWQIET